jgi:hypothetical protein
MQAFRRAHGVGILAEYRVRLPDLHREEELFLAAGNWRVT